MKKSELKEVIKGILKEEDDKTIDSTEMNFDEFCIFLNGQDWHNGDSAGSILSEIINNWDAYNQNKNQSLEQWIDDLYKHIKDNLLN